METMGSGGWLIFPIVSPIRHALREWHPDPSLNLYPRPAPPARLNAPRKRPLYTKRVRYGQPDSLVRALGRADLNLRVIATTHPQGPEEKQAPKGAESMSAAGARLSHSVHLGFVPVMRAGTRDVPPAS